eukprot:972866-Amphidinium_carterae.1
MGACCISQDRTHQHGEWPGADVAAMGSLPWLVFAVCTRLSMRLLQVSASTRLSTFVSVVAP